MKVTRHRQFKKNFKTRLSRNPKLIKKFEHRLNLFIKESTNPILKDHPLTGDKKAYRAFSITGDCRVVYERISKEEILLIDIGTHNQVY